MIGLSMLVGPLLILAGLAFHRDWREAALPLVAGLLLVALLGLWLSFPDSHPTSLLTMFGPGAAGVLLIAQAVRTNFGSVAQGIYAAVGLACLVPTLLFAFILYALSGDVQGN